MQGKLEALGRQRAMAEGLDGMPADEAGQAREWLMVALAPSKTLSERSSVRRCADTFESLPMGMFARRQSAFVGHEGDTLA